MDPSAWVSFGALAVWLALSAVCQVPSRLEQWIRRRDYAGLIPHWSFFAPQPGTWNYHLVFRDRLADGSISRWTEVDVIDPRRPWHAVWNPRRRQKKAFHDLVTQLMRLSSTTLPGDLALTVPYLVLLTWVCSLPRALATTGRQFALVFGYGATSDEPPEPAFVSALHPL